ncbi:MAG TPA: sugar phosphate isomerase/epimerase [Solirubrobacteraceae bacterium]|nr:sugar phosphate isomerase/epimerase [Solirubrobacteraceae bacterium]
MDDTFFWAGTLLPGTLEQRITAAQAGGFTCLSLFPTDYRRARERGLSDADILGLHERAGVRLVTLDPYTRWLPRWMPPPGAPAERLEWISYEEDEFFAIVEALELRTITVNEAFGARYELEELVHAFAHVCDRAARSEVRVHLEFTPFSGIPDLATAWEVVRTANRRNGGLAFDTWHYLRGVRDDALLEQIPGERIFVVQIDDAAAEPVGSLLADTLRHRRLPGEGDFDLAGVLGILAGKQGVGPPGIEVLSEELWRLEPAEIGRRCGQALRSALSLAD